MSLPSLWQIVRSYGIGDEVSDEEFLLHYSMSDQEADKMLSAIPGNPLVCLLAGNASQVLAYPQFSSD